VRPYDHRSAGDLDSVASSRVQAILALEVETGKTMPAEEHSRTDCSNGEGKSDVGARPRRIGTIPEAGDLPLAPNGACLLAPGAGSAMPKNLLATLATIRPKPRAINHCLRFPGRSDRAISSALRAHSH
jgi:hypothetical protein